MTAAVVPRRPASSSSTRSRRRSTSFRCAARGSRRAAVEVIVEPGKTADVGTITVVRRAARSRARVVADGQPVPDATVYAGRQVFGNGSTQHARTSARWGRARSTTRPMRAARSRSPGFNDGDLAIVAEHDRRSAAARRCACRRTCRARASSSLELAEVRRAVGRAAPGRQAGRGRVRAAASRRRRPARSTRSPRAPTALSLRQARARHVQGLGDRRHADDGHEVLLEGSRRAAGARGRRSISPSSPATIDGRRARGARSPARSASRARGSPPA